MNDGQRAPGVVQAGGRSPSGARPARLDSDTAERRFARLLDDAIRSIDRGTGALSNRGIGEACGCSEPRVRAWRDADARRPLTAFRLLQVPDVLFRSVLERVLAAREEAGAELAPESAPAAARAAVASMGRAITGVSLARTGELGEAERDALESVVLDAIRALRRLLRLLGRREAVS